MSINSIDASSRWVIPEQLRKARESLKLWPGDVASEIGISEDDLRKWEEGEYTPSLAELRSLSGLYRRPIRFFLVSEEVLPVSDYRLIPPEKRGIFSRETRQALVDFENWCRRLWELEQLLEIPSEVRIGQARLEEDTEEVATRERKRLEQVGLKATAPPPARFGYRDVLKDYWSSIEKLGVKIIALDIPVEEARGASWWHPEYGPAILVSQRDWTAPRLFTLCHEYAHLLLGEKDSTLLCDMKGESNIERFTNRFSAGLLVPVGAFRDGLQRRGWAGRREWDDYALGSLAQTFKVSRDVIAIRLEEMRLAEEGFYSRKRAEWDQELPELPPRMRVPRRPQWRIHIEARLGLRYEGFVLRAFREGRLTWADLPRYLDLSAQKIEQWLTSRATSGLPRV